MNGDGGSQYSINNCFETFVQKPPIKQDEFVLGIDIGTTSIKTTILNANGQIVNSNSLQTHAEINNLPGEQNVPKILQAVEKCLESLPTADLAKVARIGICGQMHGICFWKKTTTLQPQQFSSNSSLTSAIYQNGNLAVSNLFTWMDSKCSPEFLKSLPKPDSHLTVNSGFGCATIFWFLHNQPEFLQEYDYAGTIMDLIVAMLCGKMNVEPVMSRQLAASWGYFNTVKGDWNKEVLERAGFPIRFLPRIVSDEAVAGNLQDNSQLGLKAGIPIGVAFGDLQCSILSTHLTLGSAFVNISTSAQIGHIVKILPENLNNSNTNGDSVDSTVELPLEYFPYFGSTYFAVGASLNGGNVLTSFVQTIQNWCKELGLEITEDKIWSTILVNNHDEDSIANANNLQIIPTIFGERHSPLLTGSVLNITPAPIISLSNVTKAICTGLVQNLIQFMPIEYLHKVGISKIMISGSTFTRNSILKDEFIKIFGNELFKLEFVSESDASVGAALAVMNSSK